MTSAGGPGREPRDTDGMQDLSKYGVLSLVVGLTVFGLKLGAWYVTGSVGLLSDALESLVNIAAAAVAIVALKTASRPPDRLHQFGHGKAEYFSALIEGAMIVVAATMIIISAVQRLLHPEPLQQIGLGLGISVVASLLNATVAVILFRVGRQHGSMALVADAHHLVTDLWTTAGVLVAVVVVGLTGWLALDPLIALAVAANIIVIGVRLVRTSASGLMDAALPQHEVDVVLDVLRPFRQDPVVIHGLQTRGSGRQRFVNMDVLVPGSWSVMQGHDLCEHIEDAVTAALPGCTCWTHLEPLEDPRAWGELNEGQHHVD